MSDGPSVSAVRSFVVALHSVRARVISQVEQAESVRDIVYMAQRGVILRNETLLDGTRYSVHGFGCLMVDPGGAEVDVDVDDDGSEIFDSWRVSMYLESVSEGDGVPRGEISTACRWLVGEGELREVRAGWFRIAARSD
ncbi:hypothetical protein AB0I81_62995 [Nonomuraea sp. NPDC050404]|uniref:DUF6896 domain-containing protein n=1 Tax=Nonomuraea sp. NPDC050404 TaxID=3155783 RepID=UPI0033CC8FBE